MAQQVTTLGVAILRVPEQQGLSIGYTRNFSLQVNKASTAGELSYDQGNPIDFAYRDFDAIRKDYE